MPIIPQYQSKERLTTEGPQVQYSVAEAVKFGAGSNLQTLSKGVSDLGENVNDIQVRIKKIANANAESEADIQSKSDMFTIKDSIDKDPNAHKDIEGTNKYIDEQLTKSNQNAAKKFKDLFAREQYLKKVGMTNLIFKNEVSRDLQVRVVDEGRTNTLTKLDLDASDYINANTDEEKLEARKTMTETMSNGVSSMLFKQEEAHKILESKIKDSNETVKDNEKLKRRKEKELEYAEQAAKTENEKSFIKMKTSGVDKLGTPISREEQIKMANSDKTLDPQFKKLLINALTSPKAVKAKTKDADFSDMIAEVVNGVKSQEKIRNMILDITDKGYLSEEDEGNLYAFMDMIKEDSPDDLVTQNVRKSWLGIDVFSENTQGTKESRGKMSRSFIRKLQAGTDPQIAAQESMREEVLRLRPEVINYPNGMDYIDAHGRKKKIMPNGDLLLVEDKPKEKKK